MRSTRCKGRGAAFWRAPNCSPDVRTSPCKPHPALPAAAAAGPPVPFPSSNLKSSTDLHLPRPTAKSDPHPPRPRSGLSFPCAAQHPVEEKTGSESWRFAPGHTQLGTKQAGTQASAHPATSPHSALAGPALSLHAPASPPRPPKTQPPSTSSKSSPTAALQQLPASSHQSPQGPSVTLTSGHVKTPGARGTSQLLRRCLQASELAAPSTQGCWYGCPRQRAAPGAGPHSVFSVGPPR